MTLPPPEKFWNTILDEILTPQVLSTLTGLSLALALASLIITPWILTRLPPDYFQREKPHLWTRVKQASPGRATLLLLKNLTGTLLLFVGILMLVLPGQGLLTILISLMLIDFPRKRQLERRFITMPKVRRAVDWLRRKHGCAPLDLRQDDADA